MKEGEKHQTSYRDRVGFQLMKVPDDSIIELVHEYKIAWKNMNQPGELNILWVEV